MDRRTFMKLLGGLASMPIVGRLAKPLKSETVQEGIASISEGGMKLYEMVIAKVMKEGKKVSESGRVDSYKHPDRPDITVDVNQTDGSAEIYFDTDKGSKGFAEIRRDPESGGDELIEAEEVYKFFGKDGEDYVKDVEEGISGGITNLEEFTKIKKAMGGRVGYQTGGRATTADFARALKSVSAGTTYQQQRQARDYARQEASNLLSEAMRSGNQGNIQSILQGIGGRTTIPGLQFSMSGNRITGVPATGAGRDAIINAMANQMLNTTSYGTMSGGSSAPMKKSPLQLKIEENQRIYDEYIKNNPPLTGVITPGQTPKPPPPPYLDQTLLDKLTMLTPEEAFGGETFETLSDVDQYRFSQAFPQLKSQLRNPNQPRLAVMPDERDLFARRYGIKDGGSVNLTIMTMPDISGSGVESLFKTR